MIECMIYAENAVKNRMKDHIDHMFSVHKRDMNCENEYLLNGMRDIISKNGDNVLNKSILKQIQQVEKSFLDFEKELQFLKNMMINSTKKDYRGE